MARPYNKQKQRNEDIINNPVGTLHAASAKTETNEIDKRKMMFCKRNILRTKKGRYPVQNML